MGSDRVVWLEAKGTAQGICFHCSIPRSHSSPSHFLTLSSIKNPQNPTPCPPIRRSTRTVPSLDTTQPSDAINSISSYTMPRGGAPSNGRLTLKVRPSKLRQATSSSYVDADTPSDSDATPQPPIRAARSTRNPRAIVEPESDEDEEMEDEEEEQEDVDIDDTEGDLEQDNEDSEEDADGDDDDEMDELQQEDEPPQPTLKRKPNVIVTAPQRGPLKSVEDKEMEDDDEEDLSELDSNGEENGNEEDEEIGRRGGRQ